MFKTMAARTQQEETPAAISAPPPLWVNALTLKIDNFLKKSADQVSDDEAEEPVKNPKGKKKSAPVWDDEDQEPPNEEEEEVNSLTRY